MPTITIAEDTFVWLTAKAATEQARMASSGYPASFTAGDLADAIITAAIPRDDFRLITSELAAAKDDDIPF